MKTWVKFALIASVTLGPVLGVCVYGVIRHRAQAEGDSPAASAYIEVDWRVLRDLDVATGQKSKELADLDGKAIKIPGFVVPLDDDDHGLSEFLLVPSPQACIHVPPPPPNQMVMVRMKKNGTAPQRSWGPVWVKGRLHIASNDSQYGKIAYMLHADGSEPYKMPDEPLPMPMPQPK